MRSYDAALAVKDNSFVTEVTSPGPTAMSDGNSVHVDEICFKKRPSYLVFLTVLGNMHISWNIENPDPSLRINLSSILLLYNKLIHIDLQRRYS